MYFTNGDKIVSRFDSDWSVSKMYFQRCMSYILLLTPNILLNCASAAVHSHSLDSTERESDGAYRPRDADHYNDIGHNIEFDHEAILGSVKDAEEFDKLSPEESKRRLGLMLPKMDLNGDKFIDRDELKNWILNSFINLSREEADERLSEADENRDGLVTWTEYLRDSFGVDTEDELNPDEPGDAGALVREEKLMWKAADKDGDGKLDITEFEVFTNPEDHSVMHPLLVSQALREKDNNNDGVLDFNEYIGDRAGNHQDKEWLISERDKFDNELDANRDGLLDQIEIQQWLIPDNGEIAEEEVEHLFASADDDHDDLLSYEEILQHHQVFVGSEATDFGNDIDRFDDEL